MAIVISMSLTERDLASLDTIQTRLDLKGRSAAIREAIRLADAELRRMEEFDGHVEGILTIVHGDNEGSWVNKFENKYRQNIRTHIHSNLQDGRCHEIMIFSSEIKELKNMMDYLHGTCKADSVNYIKSR